MTSTVTSDSPVQALVALNEVINGGLASVEIVPGHWPDWVLAAPSNPPSPSFPFIFIERNLGIPEKTLYQLYSSAVHFRRDTNPVHILEKTNIIMLTNPAHQTALNGRKKLMLLGQHDLACELRYIELLQRGTKVCAKESVLWDHRRWCLKQLYNTIPLNDLDESAFEDIDGWAVLEEAVFLPHLPHEALETELSTIRAACSIYPRNYHAWSHWHYVFNCCYASLCQKSLDSIVQEKLLRVMLDEYQQLSRWVNSHVSDYSAFHQCLLGNQLLQRLFSSSSFCPARLPTEEPAMAQSPAALAEQVWTLISSHPPHETLLLALRSLLPHLSKTDYTMYQERLVNLPTPWRVSPYRIAHVPSAPSQSDNFVETKI